MLIIILLIVRSRCPTLFAGSNSLTNDHSTEPDDGDVRIYIKVLVMILFGNKELLCEVEGLIQHKAKPTVLALRSQLRVLYL